MMKPSEYEKNIIKNNSNDNKERKKEKKRKKENTFLGSFALKPIEIVLFCFQQISSYP